MAIDAFVKMRAELRSMENEIINILNKNKELKDENEKLKKMIDDLQNKKIEKDGK